jgi:hypothetical protein
LVTAGVVSAASALRAEEAAMHPVQSAVQSTTISGYVNTSAILKLGEDSGFALPGRSFDGVSKQNGFNLDVVSLALEKPVGDENWSAGYRAQLLFGPDANALLSNSLGANSSDFAVKNAFVALRAPLGSGLNIKMGVWDTLIGYEVFDGPNNPNYSRSYGFYIEPIVHTGVQASYALGDAVTLTGGIANGIEDRAVYNKINARAKDVTTGALYYEKLSYLGSVAITAPESMGFLAGATVYGGIVYSGIAEDPAGSDDIVNYYAGATLPTPAKALTIGVAYDYQANGLFDESYASAIGGYLSIQLSEKLKLNARAEYATGSETAYGTATGQDPELLGVVGTLDYSLWAQAITRLEFRWDHDLAGDKVFGSDDNDVMSLVLNTIFKF